MATPYAGPLSGMLVVSAAVHDALRVAIDR